MLFLRIWRVVVEPGLVLGPDRLLGRLTGVGLGALDDYPHAAAVLVEEVLHVSGYNRVARGGNRSVVGRLGHLALPFLRTSSAVIWPPFPVPSTSNRSTPNSRALRLAASVALTSAGEPLSPATSRTLGSASCAPPVWAPSRAPSRRSSFPSTLSSLFSSSLTDSVVADSA